MISKAITRASSSLKRSSVLFIARSLCPVVGTADGRVHPDPTQAEIPAGRGGDLRAPSAASVAAREPASPRFSSLGAGWQMLRQLHDRLSDSLIGDAIGLASIVVILIVFLFATA